MFNFQQTSVWVLLVMAVLLMTSVASWTLMIMQYRWQQRTVRQWRRFEERLWSSAKLPNQTKPPAQIADTEIGDILLSTGLQSWRLANQRQLPRPEAISLCQGSMFAAASRLIDTVHHRLSWLATAAHSAPYVGLLGTVIGIMHTFNLLADSQTQSLMAIAPGIAEALITTALGLVVAIPALVAHQRLVSQWDWLTAQIDGFIDEFCHLLLVK